MKILKKFNCNQGPKDDVVDGGDGTGGTGTYDGSDGDSGD